MAGPLSTAITVGDPNHEPDHESLHAFYNLMANLPRVSVRRSTNQSIPNAVATAVSFDVEEKDVGNMFSLANPTRLTIPKSGDYLFAALGLFAFSNIDKSMFFRVNGATPYAAAGHGIAGASTVYLSGSTFLPGLNAGDFVEMVVFHGSGAPLDLLVYEKSPRFSAFLVSTIF